MHYLVYLLYSLSDTDKLYFRNEIMKSEMKKILCKTLSNNLS